MPSERPSPFTIPEPTFKFAEGPPSEPPPPRSMTVDGLIRNLTGFAEFYEQASADIERVSAFEKPRARGARDANADYYQREFRATAAIDRVRGYVLSHYGEELTIGAARRVLGDLIRVHKLSVQAAGELQLDAAMDRLDANGGKGGSEGGTQLADPPLAVPAIKPTGANQSEGGAPTETLLPLMLSASDIAKRIKQNSKSVSSFLTRFADKNRDCRIENPTKRKNEPKYLYRTTEVWPALEKWLKDGAND